MSNDLNYIKILDEVERQGGAPLPGACKPRRIEYKKGRDHCLVSGDPRNTTGCAKEQRFSIPDQIYADEILSEEEPACTTVCFSDDRVDLWPRFSHALYNEDEDDE